MTTSNGTRMERTGHLLWVAVADVHVDDATQRELRPGWAATIAAEFDPDRFLPPLLSKRGDKFYVIDGQHRFEAMRIMGWDDQQLQCWVYEGLTRPQEADLFLWHNNRKSVSAFDTFRIAVEAERVDEQDIDRIVRAHNLRIAVGLPGSIAAVNALRKTYSHGPETLGRTLRIIRDAYGDSAFKGEVIEGIGLLCSRYNGDLDDVKTVDRLGGARGGLGALQTKAFGLRKQLGKPRSQCIAAAAVEIINAGKGGKKLPSWWS